MTKEILEKLLKSQKNIITSGSLSSGKTTNILFPLAEHMIEKKESILFLDSKEEYINKYYNKLKEENYNLVVLNLRELDKSNGWNPLKYIYNLYKNNSDNVIDYLERISNIIFDEDKPDEKFWSVSAANFFKGVVLSLFEDAKDEEVNLASINMMIDEMSGNFGANKSLIEYFKLKNPMSSSYIYASSAFLTSDVASEVILSSAKQKIKNYMINERLVTLLNKTTFDYNDLITKPTAIFIEIKDESKCLNSIATMFIEQLFLILIDLKNKNKFNFLLDNFDCLTKVPSLIEMLSSGPARNIKFIIGTRTIEDVIAKYSSYISKLCDTITIYPSKIETIINDEHNLISKEFKKINIEYNNIQYPILPQQQIEIFNLKDYINYTEQKNIQDNNFKNEYDILPDNSYYETYKNTNELIKKLDQKIKECEEALESEQSIKNVINDNSVSSTVIKNIELIRDDELAEKYLKEIEDEVNKILIERNLLIVGEDGTKTPIIGCNHAKWEIQKQILRERYNIDWLSPEERNPFISFN